MANKVQHLLTDAFKKLINAVYKGGSVNPKFLKVDDLGLDSTEIDFVKVLGSKEAKAIVDEFAEKVSQIGFDESEVEKITDDFVKSISDVVKITNSDLSQEVRFETNFKRSFASMILQKAQKMNLARGSNSGAGEPQGGENMADKNTQLSREGNNFYQFQIMLDASNKTQYSADTIVSMLVTSLLQQEINIDEIINIMSGKSVEFKFVQIVDGKSVDITIDDAVARVRAVLSTMISTRTDILKALVDKVTKGIDVDITDTLAAQITEISAKLHIDAELFKRLVEERLSSGDIKFSYKFQGTKLVKTELSKLVDMDEAVRLTLEKLGAKDGVLKTSKVDVTAGVLEGIREVSVQCGISVSSLIAELKNRTKITLVNEKGKELTDDMLETAVLEVVSQAQEDATVEVANKIATLIPMFRDMQLSEKAIADKIGTIAFAAEVNLDTVLDMVAARTDINVAYKDKDGKIVNMDTVLRSMLKGKLVVKAEDGVISDINTILEQTKFDGELNQDSLKNIVGELRDVAAKYSVSVEDLVSLIVENKAIAVSEYKLDGKTVGVAQVKDILVKALDAEAIKDAKGEIQDILDKVASSERELDLATLVLELKPIEAKYGIDIDTLVNFIVADKVNLNLNFYYIDEQGKRVTIKDERDLHEEILGRVNKSIKTKTENGLISALTPILEKVTREGKITDLGPVLSQISEVAVKMHIDVDTLLDALKSKFRVELNEEEISALSTDLNNHIKEDALNQLAGVINGLLSKSGGTINPDDVVAKIVQVSAIYGFDVEEVFNKVVNSGKITVKLDETSVKNLKERLVQYAQSDEVIDKLLGELSNIVLPDGTLDADRVANKITSISQAFGMDPDAIIEKLKAKDAFKAVIAPNKLKVLQDKIKGNAKGRGYAKLLEELGVKDNGDIDLGKVDLDPEVIAKKITSISVTFGIDAEALLAMLQKEDKLKGVIDFDKDDFFKKVSDKVKASAIDKFADDVNNATKGGVKGKLSHDDIKALAKKLNPIVIKYNLTEDELKLLVEELTALGKISGEIDPANKEKLMEILGKTKLDDKISYTELLSICKAIGVFSSENQTNIFNIITGLYAGNGFYNPGAGICRPASPNIIVVGGGTQYMPVGMMPGMMGGFGGGIIGGFGGGMIMPPYTQLPPYWPGFRPPDENTDKLLKALEELNKQVAGLSKRVEDLEKGGTTGGTPTPPANKEYTPTEDEVHAILAKTGLTDEQISGLDDVALDKLVDPVTKELEKAHPDYTIKGVKRTLQSLRNKLTKTKPTPPKDNKHMVTKEDIAKLMSAVGFAITDKKCLKKVPGVVKLHMDDLAGICGTTVDKLDGVDNAVKDFISTLSAMFDKGQAQPQPQQDDEIVLPDTSKPVEGKKSAWRRFWSWANRHKVMLLGIGLTVGASAIGLGFAANAVNALILNNIATGSAAAASGLLMEGGFIHGLVGRIAETGFASWINLHAPIAGAIAGTAGLGGIVATTLGAINLTKTRKLAASYNRVLKSRKKVHAANGKTRALIKQKLHLTEMLRAKQQEREDLKYSSKDRSRISKEIKDIKKEIARVDEKLGKAEKKETSKQIKELRKVEKLNRRESKFGRKVSGGKGVGTKGFTQKYIDLVQKFRAGQIDEDTFREKVEAIPKQYRRLNYDTFTTEVKEDLAKYRQNTEMVAQIGTMDKSGKKVEEIEDEFDLT